MSRYMTKGIYKKNRNIWCVWQGSGCACGSSDCGCVDGADSVGELNPF
jgi:hypothetical protein